MWDQLLAGGSKCCHVVAKVIKRAKELSYDKMLAWGARTIMWEKREERRKSKIEVKKVREEKRLDHSKTNEKSVGLFIFKLQYMETDVPIQNINDVYRL